MKIYVDTRSWIQQFFDSFVGDALGAVKATFMVIAIAFLVALIAVIVSKIAKTASKKSKNK